MPIQDNNNVLLDRIQSSRTTCSYCPPSTTFPIVLNYPTASSGVFSDVSSPMSSSYREQPTTPPSSVSPMSNHANFSPATFDHPSTNTATPTSTSTECRGITSTTGQLQIETSHTSPYHAPSPYCSPPSSSSYSPSSYRESSYTTFSTASEPAPEAMFLHKDQQWHQSQQQNQQQCQQQQQNQHCLLHEFTTTTVAVAATTTSHDKQGSYNNKRDTPPHQPLSMLSSVASLLPSHHQRQLQHANQGSGSTVIPTTIQTPRLRIQQQPVCLSQPWGTSSHSSDFTPAPTPTPTSAPHTPLQCSGFMTVPLNSPFSWSIPVSIPTPAPSSPVANSYPTSSTNGSSFHPVETCQVRTLPSNAPPLSPSADSSHSSPFARPVAVSPPSNSVPFSSSRGLSFPPSPFILPFNPPPRTSISPPSIPPPPPPSTEQQLHQLYQFHQQVQTCDCSYPIKCEQQSFSPPLTRRTTTALMTPSDVGTPVDMVKDRGFSSETSTASVDLYLSSENDDVKVEDFEQEERLFLQAIEAAQERINLSPSRKRIRGPNAGVRRSATELDGEEFADRGLARILVYTDDNLRALVAQQNVMIREPHVYDADMIDLYCLSRGDGIQGRHFHTGDNCLRNQMGCRVALAVRYAYQSDLTETHLLWVDQIDRKKIPISIVMSFPACGNLIMRALKDDPDMGAQYRILRKQGYSDPPRTSPREYGKIASLNRISWSIAFQNQRHMTTQAMGFLQRVSQAYQGAMGNPSRGMLKKRKMRAIVRESAAATVAASWQ